jgi:putative peptide zinc metalloprotease protein
MSSQLFSPLWYRVADLKPTLRRHIEIHKHVYRGEPCYVLNDQASGRVHQFSPVAHHFIALMDGRRSVQEIWDLTERAIGDDAPTQEDTIQLLAQLHGADLLKSETPTDTRELFRRYQARKSKKLHQRLLNPLSVRIPIIDPDRFLQRWMPLVRPLFGWVGLVVWLGTTIWALVLAGSHWPELTENFVDRVLTAQNLFYIWLIYPVVKMLHELGHAFAAKRQDCEVHDMGVMLLALIPIPYVDASTSAALPEKRHRILIAAAGIMVEMFLASLALFLWLTAEPGLVRVVAFNVMLIGGASTLLFNGNPLLRFDGYYILADTLGIPNLATRSQQYLAYLFRRYAGGIREARSPAAGTGDRFWLGSYAIASNVFRIGVLFGIILFVAGKFFVVGVMLAIWAATTQLVFPLTRGLNFLFENPELHGHRSRAFVISGGTIAGVALLLFAAPFPLHTQTEGIVWAPEHSEVRAEADAIVLKVIAEPDSVVKTGDPLLETEDPALAAEVKILAAKLQELTAKYQSLRSVKQVDADIVLEEIATAQANLERAQSRLDSLIIRSPADGVFLVDRPQDLVGRYLRHGDRIGFVGDLSSGTIRIAVTQDNIGLIRQQTEGVQIRMAERPTRLLHATIRRAAPSATDQIPSAALGTMGGGSLAVDPTDQSGTRTLEQVFHIELASDTPVDRLGGRAYVRIEHGSEPLGRQWYRRVRQLFLRQFNV